jgi:formylglycine-generating enzyme required for sulfatase activity
MSSGFGKHAVAPLVGLLLVGAGPGAAQQDRPGDEPGKAYRETIPGTTVSLEMVPVPAGRAPGSGAGVGPLWMSRIEVPWDAYDVWVFGLDEGGQISTGKGEDAVSRPSKPYVLPGEQFGHQGRPAIAITHHGAEAFAKWLSEKTGRRYRLPTEAEWEYACRAGGPEAPAALAEVAWYAENSEAKTHAGGTRKPNAFGLSDMLGNVAEWVTPAEGDPVVKGGSWDDAAADVTCAARREQSSAWNATDPQLPKSRWWLPDAPFVGFRLVREP